DESGQFTSGGTKRKRGETSLGAKRKTLGPYITAEGKREKGLYWVNNRLINVNRITDIKQDNPGKYTVTTESHGTYTVEGGRHLGGGPRQWFLSGTHIKGDIDVTGLKDAIDLIENM